MSFEELTNLTLNTLKSVIEGEITADQFEISMIKTEDKVWKLLTVEENQQLLDALPAVVEE